MDKPFKHYDLHPIYCALTWRNFDFSMTITDLRRNPEERPSDAYHCFGFSPVLRFKTVAPGVPVAFNNEDDMCMAMTEIANDINTDVREGLGSVARLPYFALLAEFQHWDRANDLLITFKFTKL